MLTNIVSDSALVFLGRARLGVVTSGNKQLGPYNRQTEDCNLEGLNNWTLETLHNNNLIFSESS